MGSLKRVAPSVVVVGIAHAWVQNVRNRFKLPREIFGKARRWTVGLKFGKIWESLSNEDDVKLAVISSEIPRM